MKRGLRNRVGWGRIQALGVPLVTASMLIGIARADPAKPPPDLGSVLERMASTPGVEASYVERKELALLAAPLESRGVIYFVPPDRFARFTTEPGFSSLVVDGRGVRFREGREGEELDLSGSPMARGFVESFMSLWRGDREELSLLYELEFRREGEKGWQLQLTPRRAPLSRMIGAIVLRGDDGGMREMSVEEKDGDRTVTTFEQVDPRREYGEVELRRIFETREPLAGGPGGAAAR